MLAKSSDALNYYIAQAVGKRSLNPLDSDVVTNSLHMIQLVGTLVKFNSANSYVPYLAEKWSKENSGRVWNFKFKDGLKCEDGTEINSKNYIKGMLRAFKNHSFKSDTPIFSNLIGWQDFYEGKIDTIAGIKAIDKLTLRFEFKEIPDGVELYLSMPYYGFYCETDFDEQGKWKDERKITSSGPYRLKSFDEERDLISLELRRDWPLIENPAAAKTINIFVSTNEDIYTSFQPRTLIGASMDEKTVFDRHWTVFKGAKIISGNLILNPRRGPFKSLSIRKAFAEKIRRIINSKKDNFEWIIVSSKFYPFVSNESKREEPTSMSQVPPANEPIGMIKVVDLLRNNQRVELIYSVIDEAFGKEGVGYEIVPRSKVSMTEMQAAENRRNSLDLYLINVDKGGAATTSVVGMMFCSDLGANFPDPSGRVCELVKKYGGRELSSSEATEFGQEFERIVEEDAAVIPIVHRGQNWLYSDDLDLSAMTPNMTFPDLQLIKLK